ncbi:DUF4892 domain-containing protein [Parahaliea maris]|uniref:DUF4892 domain-containing protein n=1 Tax=Parahaliea maris TaxID=2716870 RepID=UPI001650B42B|nr:DUF4892 domain-containing protein [Parahaliea maris]
MHCRPARTCFRLFCGLLLLGLGSAASAEERPEALLAALDAFPHAVQIANSRTAVVDYEVGLGAMQKHLGDWQFKRSRRVDGERVRYTWQITDGFSAEEVFTGLVGKVTALPDSERLFGCEGRACGNGAQWANRVFAQRVLYGRADAQRYEVYSVGGEGGYLVLAYAAARTSDRQYLHAEVIRLAPQLQE